MKLNHTKITVFFVAFAICLIATNAQGQENTTNTSVTPVRATVQNKLETRVDNRNANVEIRKEIQAEKKATLIDVRTEAKERMSELKVKRDIKVGSTTEMFKRVSTARTEVVSKMRTDAFKARKEALTKQLNITLENLSNISARISERIQKAEEAGRTMTEAKASLVIADEKLATARTAVKTLEAYIPTTSTSSTEVDVEKPRQIGDAAIKAIKEARDAYKKVIQDIAKNIGSAPRASSPVEVQTEASAEVETNN